MRIELSEPIQQALATQSEGPLRVIDPRTQKMYVLLPADLYERVQSLFEGNRLTEDERRVILQGVWKRAGWDDPAMDDYEALDPRKQS